MPHFQLAANYTLLLFSKASTHIWPRGQGMSCRDGSDEPAEVRRGSCANCGVNGSGPTRQRLSVRAVCPPNLLMYSWGQEVLHQINGRDLHSFPLECAWSALLSTAGGETSSLAEPSNFPQNLTTEKLTGEEEASDSPRWHNASHWIILIDIKDENLLALLEMRVWESEVHCKVVWNEELGLKLTQQCNSWVNTENIPIPTMNHHYYQLTISSKLTVPSLKSETL